MDVRRTGSRSVVRSRPSLSLISGFFAADGHINTQRASRCLDQDALCGVRWLVPETELLDQRAIGLEVTALEIGQQPAPGADHLQETAPPVVVLGVRPEVIG